LLFLGFVRSFIRSNTKEHCILPNTHFYFDLILIILTHTE